MFCKHCGVNLNNESRFCHSCGKTLNQQPKLKQDNPLIPYSLKKKKMGGDEIVVIMFVFISLIAAISYFTIYPKVKEYLQNKKDKVLQSEKVVKDQTTELANIKKELESVKKKTNTIIPQNNNNNSKGISASEISKYLSGVVEIDCSFVGDNSVQGSGSLWNFDGLKHVVLTNNHVAGEGNCFMTANKEASDKYGGGIYNLGKDRLSWNSLTDVSVLKISSILLENKSTPIANLNYNISNLSMCNSEMSVGSSVIVIGYPVFAKSGIDLGERGVGSLSNRTITEGIISAYDTSVKYNQKLPHSNYFVSAKIDSGNSGGIAISKDNKGLCVLGIPTWVSVGNYETSGLIQNIHNVLFTN